VTLRAVAQALGRSISFNKEMAAQIREAYGGAPLSAEQEKMAMLPEGARLRMPPGAASKWPIVQVENVFVLPGVPAFFEAKLDLILEHFVAGGLPPVHTRKLVLSVVEGEIVRALNEVVALFPALQLGSYPVNETDFKTVVTIEGEDEVQVEAALKALAAEMRPGTVVRRPSKNLEHMLN